MPVLIQTRLPDELGDWVAERAALEGLSVAAWLRRLIIKEARTMRIEACTQPVSEPLRAAELIKRQPKPAWLLEHRRDLEGGAVEFALLHGSGHPVPGAPVTVGFLQDGGELINRPGDRRFGLRGSAHEWEIVRTWHDVTSDRVVVVLKPLI